MKSQAETAGRLSNPVGAPPQRGTVLRDLEITLANGTHCLLSSLRGSSSLVMIFTAGRELQGLVADLAHKKSELKEHNGRVLVVATATAPPALSTMLEAGGELFLLAVDEAERVHKALGATDAAQNSVPSIFITDRFGEIFAASGDLPSLPSAEEIIRTFEFIEQQCEECSPPEWP